MDSSTRSKSNVTSSSAAYQPKNAANTIGRFRWVICAVLLLGTTKNYMDRQLISVLKSTLQHDLGWNEIDYGNLVFYFQAAYALGMVVMGRLIDKLGTRLGYAVAMVGWSLASMAHGVMSTLTGFKVARFALGFGEASVFPASLKATSEWFPRKDRALAVGILNAGTNIGAALAPLLISLIFARWGWRPVFFIIGALGFVWLVLWLWIYRKPEKHPRCSPQELQYICSDPIPSPSPIPWVKLLPHRQTWAFAVGKFIIDPIWWFYLFWIPDFLQRSHGLPLLRVGLPLFVIYFIADVGSVAGGWISSAMLHRGKSVNASRKTAMLVCAVCVIPIVFAPNVASTWGTVLLIGLATAAHQGFSSNLFTLPSDMFPTKAVASVVGIGGMAGAVGGMLIAKIVAYLLQWTGSYTIPFLMAGCAYLVALGAIQILAPKLEPARIDDTGT